MSGKKISTLAHAYTYTFFITSSSFVYLSGKASILYSLPKKGQNKYQKKKKKQTNKQTNMCSWWRWRYAEGFRWPELEFSLPSWVFRWRSDWNLNWDLSIVVDDVVWGLVMVVESLALLSMLCYFFLFCGCTL